MIVRKMSTSTPPTAKTLMDRGLFSRNDWGFDAVESGAATPNVFEPKTELVTNVTPGDPDVGVGSPCARGPVGAKSDVWDASVLDCEVESEVAALVLALVLADVLAEVLDVLDDALVDEAVDCVELEDCVVDVLETRGLFQASSRDTQTENVPRARARRRRRGAR